MHLHKRKVSASLRCRHYFENNFGIHRIRWTTANGQAVPAVIQTSNNSSIRLDPWQWQASGCALGARSAVHATRRDSARRLGDLPGVREGASHEDYQG